MEGKRKKENSAELEWVCNLLMYTFLILNHAQCKLTKVDQGSKHQKMAILRFHQTGSCCIYNCRGSLFKQN